MLAVNRVTKFLDCCLALKDWRISDLSRATYISRSTLDRMQGGAPATNPSMIALIAYAVGVDPHASVNYVINGTGDLPHELKGFAVAAVPMRLANAASSAPSVARGKGRHPPSDPNKRPPRR